MLAAWLAWGGGVRVAAAQDDSALVVRRLAFTGNRALDDTRLAAAIVTTASSWFARASVVRWLGLGERRRLSELEFQRDVARLRFLYRLSGYPQVVVDTMVVRRGGDVAITFRIEEGLPIRLERLTLAGLDSVDAALRAAVTRGLPLHVGDPFDRAALAATIDTITRRLRDRGHPFARGARAFSTDPLRLRAQATVTVEPGPAAVVGEIRVEGTRRVAPEVVRKLLLVQPGRPYAEADLFGSQLQLYRADLFRFAGLAADTARFDPSTGRLPLVVAVQEAPPRRVRASGGYGTNDCLRGSAALTQRDFLGGGQLLDVSARVSKVGVAAGADLGLADNICALLVNDTIGSSLLNYNVTATLRRPGVFGARNTLALSVFTERRSQFGVYLREEDGASVSLTRETGRLGIPVTVSYALSRGRTQASEASFCTFFAACSPDVVLLQSQRLPIGRLAVSATRARVTNPLDPVRGSVLTAEVTHSAPWLGSDTLQRFTRMVVDGSWYAALGRTVTLALHARGGLIFGASDVTGTPFSFVPLDQRFFAGGPNDVRGYQLNQLGPVGYLTTRAAVEAAGNDAARLPPELVRVAATGANTLAVGNAELRFAAPFWSRRLRLALFVDGGSLWQRGDALTENRVALTPGVGLRVGTPLGPARLDLAWNPRNLSRGILYVEERDGTVSPALVGYAPDRGATFPTTGRFPTLHIAVGQPF
ncbi:MAG: BamA/TamA family outer membrane protein [Gemmatimonadales bacterium]|nr:BamA/TamA family outer membrane protein [Gemmatimonadales bacterium]